ENGLNKTTSSFDETNLLQSIDLKVSPFDELHADVSLHV
ncbi:unnamed protein product, partial [Rotaria magnacalcarata]